MAETRNTILERLLNLIPGRFRKDTGSFVSDLETPVAVEFENAYDLMEQKQEQSYIATASGSYLDSKIGEFGKARAEAMYASGEVTITGTAGALVRAGDLTAAGAVAYRVMEDAEIPEAGTVTVPVQCTQAGKIGNAKAGAVNRFPITQSGIHSVINEKDITGGIDRETDTEYRDRFYAYIRHPVTSGNKYQYEEWAREAAKNEIVNAKCYPLRHGPGTVEVMIIPVDMELDHQPLLERVRAYIEEQRPVGAEVTVILPQLLTVQITCSVKFEAGADQEAVAETVKRNLTGYLHTLGYSGGEISYARIGAVIIDTPGIYDYDDLRINGGAENLPLYDGYVPVLGGVDFV